MFLQPDLTNHISAKLMLMDRASEERDCYDNQKLELVFFLLLPFILTFRVYEKVDEGS